MDTETYVVLLSDGDKEYAVPALDGSATREETLERVEYWNTVEGFTARLGIVSPLES